MKFREIILMMVAIVGSFPFFISSHTPVQAQSFVSEEELILKLRKGKNRRVERDRERRIEKHRAPGRERNLRRRAPEAEPRIVKRRAPERERKLRRAPEREPRVVKRRAPERERKLRRAPEREPRVVKRRAPERERKLRRAPEREPRVVKRRAPERERNLRRRAPEAEPRIVKRRAPERKRNLRSRVPDAAPRIVKRRAPVAEPRIVKRRVPEKRLSSGSKRRKAGSNSQTANVQRRNPDVEVRSLSTNELIEDSNLASIDSDNYPETGSIDLEILFDYNSDKIDPKSVRQLITLGDALNDGELSASKFVVAGHTDAVGNDSYNEDLSTRRARAVTDFLINYAGVSENRLTPEGYGESLLKYPDAPESGQNRRVEIINVGEED